MTGLISGKVAAITIGALLLASCADHPLEPVVDLSTPPVMSLPKEI